MTVVECYSERTKMIQPQSELKGFEVKKGKTAGKWTQYHELLYHRAEASKYSCVGINLTLPSTDYFM